MNLIFRLLYTLVVFSFRKPVGTMGPCRTPFRCWFTDLDTLMHMNNGIYFSLMDLARVDFMGRSGLLKVFQEKGWYPVVVAETASFRKSLQLFERFEIESKVIGWDDQAILLQQKFFKGEKLVCDSVIRARFLKKEGGKVDIAELIEATGVPPQSPAMEPWIEAWNRSQAAPKK